MIIQFTERTLPRLYDELAAEEKCFRNIINEYGHPPLWVRPNSFETLVLTILEQQVSLASAYAAYTRLKNRLAEIVPESLLQLSDEDLRACSFTRQKISYVRGLAEAIINKKIDLQSFEHLPDAEVRNQLKQLKGIGDWTVDIYLLHALQRTDIFPLGDLALVNGMRMVYGDPSLSKEAIAQLAERWKPYRSMATMLFWHYYIQKKGIKLLH
ncbi:MAG: DNA-3-methyladenine glycosylase 2 family protein [Flaviaesturariibacter sp.]|nr:DNA-3-methyladenine glycosylase 2 family protein [Flaviaesturariibacter sp.]